LPGRRRWWEFPRRPCSGACTRPGSCWRSGWLTLTRPRRPVARRQREEAPPMASNPQVHRMLKEMLELGKTPEEVCRDCPELLPEVQQRWRQFQLIDVQVRSLLPGLATRPDADASTPPESAPTPPAAFGRYQVRGALGAGGVGHPHLRPHTPLAPPPA